MLNNYFIYFQSEKISLILFFIKIDFLKCLINCFKIINLNISSKNQKYSKYIYLISF